jgi:alpha-tubulin suppressor-like RCC1 family protein
VPGLGKIVAIAAGKQYSLALREDGTVSSWGYNGGGALGDSTCITRLAPVAVADLDGVKAIAAGGSNGLALRTDGTVCAWGYNAWGGCGDGLGDNARPTVRVTPVQVTQLTGAVAIAAGAGHCLALRADGMIWAWGLNEGAPLPALGGGQLGDGTMTHRSTPVQVVGLAGAIAIAAGGGHSLALTSDGAVWPGE